jgi:hypothetical protein
MTDNERELPEDVLAMVWAARRKAYSLPGEAEVNELAQRASLDPAGLSAAEVRRLGDMASSQAHQVAVLLRRLADLVEGDRD